MKESEVRRRIMEEKSCFYSLSFLTEAKDALSSYTWCVSAGAGWLLLYSSSIVEYCILSCVDVYIYNNCIITVSAQQSGKHSNIMRKDECARTFTHARLNPHIISSCSRSIRAKPGAQTLCHSDAEIIKQATGVFNFWRKIRESCWKRKKIDRCR